MPNTTTSPITPLIFDDSSLRSLLVWDDPKDCSEGGPVSIVSLVKEAKLSAAHFVSPTFYSFIKAKEACEKLKVDLRFGLEVWVTNDLSLTRGSEDTAVKENSRNNESKVIIWMKNGDGYKDLVKLYTAYRTDKDAFYYHQRADWALLKRYWTPNLYLTFPFFDSFLARNTLVYGAAIMPDLASFGPYTLFREVGTDHPWEVPINGAIERYVDAHDDIEITDTKTVYYKGVNDFKAYTVYRCLENRTTFDKPEIPLFCSASFSWDKYLEIAGSRTANAGASTS